MSSLPLRAVPPVDAVATITICKAIFRFHPAVHFLCRFYLTLVKWRGLHLCRKLIKSHY